MADDDGMKTCQKKTQDSFFSSIRYSTVGRYSRYEERSIKTGGETRGNTTDWYCWIKMFLNFDRFFL